MTEKEIIKIIEARPRATGFQIHSELRARSRVGAIFGSDSMLTALFGPSIGSMYMLLMALEGRGVIASVWGVATEERGGYRPRHYWIVEK